MPAIRNISFGLLIGLIALFAAGKVVLSDTLDPDAFWHLQVADRLAANGIGPLVDDLSFSSIREPWTPYSWLAELGMKVIWDTAGLPGAVATTAVLSAAFVVLLAGCASMLVKHRAVHRTSFMPVIAATTVGALLSLPNLSFRPVTLAIVLLAVIALLVLRDRTLGERTRALWTIVPLTALCINIHLAAVLVPMIVGALLVGACFEPESTRQRKRYALLLVATSIACCLTPMLPGMVRTMMHYQSSDPMISGGIIAELRPAFSGWMGMLTGLLLAMLFALFLRHRAGLRLGEVLWLAGMLLLAARHNRFSPMLAIIACPLIARSLPGLSDRLLGKRAVAILAGVILCFGTIRVIASIPSSRVSVSHWLNRNGSEAPGYPCSAAEYVAQNIPPSSGRLINEFSWGGYLSWKLAPQYQVFLDERTQLFAPDFWNRVYFSEPYVLRDALEGARADVAIVPTDRSRFKQTLIGMGWRKVYRDDRAEVLVPPTRDVARTE